MKITGTDLYLFDTPLPSPLANPITSGASITTLLAVVHTDAGISGQGYGWTVGQQRAKFIAGATEVAAEFALGRDPTCMEGIWSAYEGFSNFVGTTGLATMGMSILDIAFWDIASRSLEVPLWRMLGGHKPKARMYMNLINSDTSGKAPVEVLKEASEQAWARGFRDFKCRIGLSEPKVDADRMRRLVAAANPAAKFSVDIAQRWSGPDALAGCAALDDIGLFWIEDPGHQDDIEGMRNIVSRSRTPICTGENAYALKDPTRIVEQIKPAYLMLDLERCGGITGWRKAAAVAQAHHIRMTTHVYSHVGVQIVCGTSNATIGEYLPWWDDLLGGPVEVVDGYATASEKPGIGAHFEERLFSKAYWRSSVKNK